MGLQGGEVLSVAGGSVARELMVLTDPRAGRAESPPGALGGDKTQE